MLLKLLHSTLQQLLYLHTAHGLFFIYLTVWGVQPVVRMLLKLLHSPSQQFLHLHTAHNFSSYISYSLGFPGQPGTLGFSLS